jgi:hypothetical protein
MENLKKFGVVPVNNSVLASVFDGYKSPNDKMSSLMRAGNLIRLKRGLYVVSPVLSGNKLSRQLVANHLYGPSYVSLESALSFYGLIPERVYAVRSITSRRAKSFSNPLGHFEYLTVPESYFAIGVKQEIVNDEYAFLIASPEKAVCDMIVTNRNFRIQSVKAMQKYLFEDLRVDFSGLTSINLQIIKDCIDKGKKQLELSILLKTLEK